MCLGRLASIMLPDVPKTTFVCHMGVPEDLENNSKVRTMVCQVGVHELLSVLLLCCTVLCSIVGIIYLRVVECSFLLLLLLPNDNIATTHGELPRFVVALLKEQLPCTSFALELCSLASQSGR